MTHKLLIALLLCIPFTTALYAEHDHDHEAHEDDDFEFTEHEAHEHGRAIAEISYADNQLNVYLIIPAINVLGFEHTPNTQEEKKIADAIIAKLSDPKHVLEINTACTVASTYIEEGHEVGDDHEEHEHESDHDQHHEDEDHHDEHEHESDHDQHHENETHHDEHQHESHHEHDHEGEHEPEHFNIEIEHEYDCQSNDEVMLSFSIFKTLPTLEKLDIQYVSEEQQQLSTLTPDDITFTAH